MTCHDLEQFLSQETEPDEIRRVFSKHLATCQDCRKALDAFEKLRADLLGLSPTDVVSERILQQTLQRVPNISKTGVPKIVGLIGFLAVFTAVLAYFLFSGGETIEKAYEEKKPAIDNERNDVPTKIMPLPVVLAKVSGEFFLKKIEGAVSPEKNVSITSPSDRVILQADQSCHVAFSEDRVVLVSQQCDFSIPENGSIILRKGDCTFNLSSSPKGYQISLPGVVLGVLGTVIRFRVQDSVQIVWVENGLVDWKSTCGKQSGQLKTETGISVLSDGIVPISEFPSEEQPLPEKMPDASASPTRFIDPPDDASMTEDIDSQEGEKTDSLYINQVEEEF